MMPDSSDHNDLEGDLPNDGWRLADEAADEADDESWPAEDLESAYRRALAANDVVEFEFADDAPETDSDESSTEEGQPSGATEAKSATSGRAADNVETSGSGSVRSNPVAADTPVVPRVTASQVIEAALFVGGEPLASKKLCYMLRGDYDLDAVDSAIEELNQQYIRENRPYEIRLGEGGYRLALTYEFERVRNRVFGIGPREVRLSQEVLEVLALVAYYQPVSPERLTELGKPDAASILRQLLRRELVALTRTGKKRNDVEYSTTRRFLSVFGLSSIEELPRAEDLLFR